MQFCWAVQREWIWAMYWNEVTSTMLFSVLLLHPPLCLCLHAFIFQGGINTACLVSCWTKLFNALSLCYVWLLHNCRTFILLCNLGRWRSGKFPLTCTELASVGPSIMVWYRVAVCPREEPGTVWRSPTTTFQFCRLSKVLSLKITDMLLPITWWADGMASRFNSSASVWLPGKSYTY